MLSVLAFDKRIICVDDKNRSVEAEEYILHAKKAMQLAGKLAYSSLWLYYPTKNWKLFVESYDHLNKYKLNLFKNS